MNVNNVNNNNMNFRTLCIIFVASIAVCMTKYCIFVHSYQQFHVSTSFSKKVNRPQCHFPFYVEKQQQRCGTAALHQSTKNDEMETESWSASSFEVVPRRKYVLHSLTTALSVMFMTTMKQEEVGAITTPSPPPKLDVDSIVQQLKVAQKQLEPIPKLIEKEQWDSVRAILGTPPLSDCWSKSSMKIPLLQQYAENVAKDELNALEIKEELQSHLRYLDMAVYNNVFNPIRTVGTIGATKELIRSYYEDPLNEYKTTAHFFNELLDLAN